MKKIRYVISLSLICTLLLTACGGTDRPVQTPQETIDTAFTALRELDMETFNACSNNKIGSGFHLFSDLCIRSPKESNLLLAQVIMEHFSWEITNVQVDGDTAIADVTVHNKDFSDAVGAYVADIIAHISHDLQENGSVSKLLRDSMDEARNSPENLLPYLQACDKDFTAQISVILKRVNDNWQIQLDDSLCDNLTGNLGSDSFSEDVIARISAAEELLSRNMERWGDHMEKNADDWAGQLETRLNELFQ